MCLKAIFCKNCEKNIPQREIGLPQATEKTVEMAYQLLKGVQFSEEEKIELKERLEKNSLLIHVGDVKIVNKFGLNLCGDLFEKSITEAVFGDCYAVVLNDKVLFQYVVDSCLKKNSAFIVPGNRVIDVVAVR